MEICVYTSSHVNDAFITMTTSSFLRIFTSRLTILMHFFGQYMNADTEYWRSCKTKTKTE